MSGLPPWLAPTWSRLAPALAGERLTHALLFVGPPGVGKRLLADRLARLLMCQSPRPGFEPCGECRGCAQMAAGSHPDYVALAPEEGAREIRVGQTRAFSQRLGLTAHYDRRVGIIDPAEAFTTSAANSLLKTLEEPPSGVHLLLVSERPGRVLATIRSRCQRVRVPMPDHAAVEEWVSEQGEGMRDALALARGAPLRAEALAEAGIVERLPQWREDLTALLSGKRTPVAIAERWHKEPERTLLDWLYLTLSDLLKFACGVADEQWVHRGEHARALASVAESIETARLRRLVPVIVETRRLLETNVDRQLLWESLAIELWASRKRGDRQQ